MCAACKCPKYKAFELAFVGRTLVIYLKNKALELA